MKRKPNRHRRNRDRDTMRPEYDFSGAVRGVTAARYALRRVAAEPHDLPTEDDLTAAADCLFLELDLDEQQR